MRGYQPFTIDWAERRRFLAGDLLAANDNPVAPAPRVPWIPSHAHPDPPSAAALARRAR